MPQILLHTPLSASGDTDTSPLTLIEFQGDLAAEQADLSGLTIGTLKFSQTRVRTLLILRGRREKRSDLHSFTDISLSVGQGDVARGPSSSRRTGGQVV